MVQQKYSKYNGFYEIVLYLMQMAKVLEKKS